MGDVGGGLAKEDVLLEGVWPWWTKSYVQWGEGEKTQNKFGTICGLLDILFAYCYDIRVNFGKDCECFSRFQIRLKVVLS